MAEGRDYNELPVLLRYEHAVDAHVSVVIRKPRLEDALDSYTIYECISEEVYRELLHELRLEETLIALPVDLPLTVGRQVYCMLQLDDIIAVDEQLFPVVGEGLVYIFLWLIVMFEGDGNE